MRLQPNRNYVSNDDIQTPPALARQLVRHFRPKGRILEPCKGDGNFLKHLPQSAAWCEIKKGRDFFAWGQKVNWIITNPPWSQLRRFLQQAMTVADHVVFLLTINHVWTRARLRDIKAAGFGLREIVMIDRPKSFPPMGFQLGAVYLCRGWTGPITLTDWSAPVCPTRRIHHSATTRAWPVNGSDRSTMEELRRLQHRMTALLAE